MRLILILLVLCGCATQPVARRAFKADGGDEVQVLVETPGALYWECDDSGTPGFVVEQTADMQSWVQIGYVPASQVWRTNATGLPYTYRFLTDHTAPVMFFRVGATLPPRTAMRLNLVRDYNRSKQTTKKGSEYGKESI